MHPTAALPVISTKGKNLRLFNSEKKNKLKNIFLVGHYLTDHLEYRGGKRNTKPFFIRRKRTWDTSLPICC